MLRAGTLSGFTFGVSSAPGNGNKWTVTVELNGVDTTMKCEVSGGTSTSCNGVVSSISVAKNDLLSIRVDPDSGPSSASAFWSALFVGA
ncbi:MAG: hypothetical protein WA687_11460 [Solirubrobacterales bacterium]